MESRDVLIILEFERSYDFEELLDVGLNSLERRGLVLPLLVLRVAHLPEVDFEVCAQAHRGEPLDVRLGPLGNQLLGGQVFDLLGDGPTQRQNLLLDLLHYHFQLNYNLF